MGYREGSPPFQGIVRMNRYSCTIGATLVHIPSSQPLRHSVRMIQFQSTKNTVDGGENCPPKTNKYEQKKRS